MPPPGSGTERAAASSKSCAARPCRHCLTTRTPGYLDVREASAVSRAEAWREKYPTVTVTPRVELGSAGQVLLSVATRAQSFVLGRRVRRSPIGPSRRISGSRRSASRHLPRRRSAPPLTNSGVEGSVQRSGNDDPADRKAPRPCRGDGTTPVVPLGVRRTGADVREAHRAEPVGELIERS